MTLPIFKQKKAKKIIIIFICILISIVLASKMCNYLSKDERIKKSMMGYLNKNYNDTFVMYEYTPYIFLGNGPYAVIMSEKYNETFEIYAYKEKGEYRFQEDYFKIYMKKDAERYFSKSLKKYGVNAKFDLKFSGIIHPIGNRINITFLEHVKSGNCFVDLHVDTNNFISQAEIYNLLEYYAINKIDGFFSFNVIDKQHYNYQIDDNYKIIKR